ncbi:MAG TPA: Sec-independent protein translocase protein TatB [Rhodocyclaceae bacterium]|jgi:sec-independent protein translocase protein TatB|nr:Sec-independent protein translocase protein TatB [Rhodocyclaceae bacterium]
MFDIGFSELVLIALVALVVLGPERLPRVARTVGALLGRLQRYVNEVKTEVRREMEIEDLKKLQSQVVEQMREVEDTLHKEVGSVESAIHDMAQEVRAEGDATTKNTAEASKVETPKLETAAVDHNGAPALMRGKSPEKSA